MNTNKDQNEGVIDDLDWEGHKRSAPAAGLPESKAKLIHELLANIRESAQAIEKLLAGSLPESASLAKLKLGQVPADLRPEAGGDGRIIEGVFDGENMIGPDGKQYSVPANYASKSKLVEGDILKLTITATGTFVYKQISPIERVRLVGEIRQDAAGAYTVHADGRYWRVLTASVTYFKGQAGDEAIILVPRGSESKWAAVENVVKRKF